MSKVLVDDFFGTVAHGDGSFRRADLFFETAGSAVAAKVNLAARIEEPDFQRLLEVRRGGLGLDFLKAGDSDRCHIT